MFVRTPIISVPITVPVIILAPGKPRAANHYGGDGVQFVGDARVRIALIILRYKTPLSARSPDSEYTIVFTHRIGNPASRAAVSLSPTARTCRPNTVRPSKAQNATASTA